MNSHPHIAVLDFDSQNVLLAVGTRDTTSLTQPLLRAEAYPNESIRRGTVIDTSGITGVVGQILRTLDTTYQHKLPIFLGVHPSSMSAHHVSVSISLFQNNQPRSITDADCEMLDKKAQALISAENPNSYILTTIPRQYILDNTRLAVGASPVGYQANKLTCNYLILTCLTHDVSNFVDIFETYNTDVHDVFPTPLNVSLMVTAQKQRILGCGVLYVSSEVTSLVIYEDGSPLFTATYPIGIEDIMSDLAVGLEIPIEKSRILLMDSSRLSDESNAVQKRFNEIINARFMDITEKIERTLSSIGRPVVMPAGLIVITTNVQLHSLCDSLYTSLKIPAKLWEGEIPSAQSKKRNRDISIIGAYSILCSVGSSSKPIYSSKTAIKRIFVDIKSSISSLVHKFLS